MKVSGHRAFGHCFLIASALGVAHTTGFNWIEHIIQVVLAAVGVAIVAGTGRRRA